MEINRVIFVNATLDGNAHEMVDSSLIVSFAQKCPVEVYFLKRRSEIIKGLVESYYPNLDVRFHSLNNIKKDGAIKDCIGAVLEFLILLFRCYGNRTLLVCSYANMFSRYSLNWGCKMFKKRVLICTHSELESLIKIRDERDVGYWIKLMGNFFLNKNLAEGIRFLVLGDVIKNNVERLIPRTNLLKFISIDHPYYHFKSITEKSLNPSEIHIGVVGTISKNSARGFDNLLDFAKMMKKHKNVKIHLISKINPLLQEQLSEYVVIENKSNRFLPKKEYEAMIQRMDYLYYPYPKEAFKLTASGAIFEAIINLTPSLMYSNDFFLYLTGKFGRFGIFIDELDEKSLIDILSDTEEYNKTVTILRQFSSQINPVSLSYELYRKIQDSYC